MEISNRKVTLSSYDMEDFSVVWPGLNYTPNRQYWFEFDINGNLVDCNVHEHEDGYWATVLASDCFDYLFKGIKPNWLLE